MTSAPNDPIEQWNGAVGAKWTSMQDVLDTALDPFGRAAIDAAEVARGDRALDVGCGCGATTLELVDRVGESGDVLAVDISAPMLERARQRTSAARFVEADAGTYRFARDRTVLISRFGVMFFLDPVAAFTNLRTALVPGARLAFACWRPLAENAWMRVPLDAARPHLPVEPPGDPHAPGPFAFADRARVASILAAANFSVVRVDPFDAPVAMPPFGVDAAVDFSMAIGPLARAAASVDDAAKAAIRDRVRAALAPHTTDSRVALPGAAWIVTARAA